MNIYGFNIEDYFNNINLQTENIQINLFEQIENKNEKQENKKNAIYTYCIYKLYDILLEKLKQTTFIYIAQKSRISSSQIS